jgi:hypothetical protein
MTDRIVAAIAAAAKKRNAIAAARVGELAAELDNFINAGEDGLALMKAKKALNDIDPIYPVETAAFRAIAAKDLKNTGAALKKASTAQSKAQGKLATLKAEIADLQKQYAEKIDAAQDALDEATHAHADAKVDDNRYRALSGEFVESQSAYSDPVLREWAKQVGIVN